MPTDFKSSTEAAVRRIVRQSIRKSKLSKYERDVALTLAKHWFHHYQKGVIHPGRQRIARISGCSIKTVSRMMERMRDAGALIVISRPKGEGQKPTVYKLDIRNLLIMCGCDMPENTSGTILEMSHHFTPKCPTTGGSESPTDKYTVEDHRCQSEIICFSEYNR